MNYTALQSSRTGRLPPQVQAAGARYQTGNVIEQHVGASGK